MTRAQPYRVTITHNETGATLDVDAEHSDARDVLDTLARRGVPMQRAAALLEDELGAPYGGVARLRRSAEATRERVNRLRGKIADHLAVAGDRTAAEHDREADELERELRGMLRTIREGAPA